jgi:tetratricopeptide (TPR) repeat protein
VTVDETHPLVHHPLTVDDVKGLLSRLPVDVRPFVQSVHLRSGFHEDHMFAGGATRDPFTGRYGFETAGGIWVPPLLGRYRAQPGEIDLFGYVYDDAKLRVREIQRVLLWLRQAQTLIHEVAHCWDGVKRTARDRWALDEEYRYERYADESAHKWLVEAAVPYFRQQRADEVHAFESWIETQMGLHISLERAAEDADRSMWGIVEGLFEITAKWNDADQLNLRLELAEQFHFVDDFAPARQILEATLGQRPDDERAVILMGDIAVHEKDWQRALEWTGMALRLAPGDVDAHLDRVDALVGAQEWKEGIAACEHALRILDLEAATDASFRLERALCLMEVGEFANAGEELDRVIAQGPPGRTKDGRALRAEWLVRQSRWAEAREAALAALRTRQYLWHQAILTAAAWESAQRLDQTDAKPLPTQRHLDLLRHNGRNAWAERLLALGLKPAAERRTRRQATLARPQGPLTRL